MHLTHQAPPEADEQASAPSAGVHRLRYWNDIRDLSVDISRYMGYFAL